MKHCPNCGAELAPDDKFCTKCGFTLPIDGQKNETQKVSQANQSAQPQATTNEAQPNQTVAVVQGYATNYFQWLWAALKKPFNNDENAGRYFGLISFAIIIFLNAFALNTVVQRVEKVGTDTVNSFASLFSDSSSTDSAAKVSPISFLWQFILLGLIVYIVFIGVSYAFSHLVTRNLDHTFLDYVNRLAHYTSSILVLALIQFLDSFIVKVTSGSIFYIILIALQVLILLLCCLLSVVPQQGVVSGFDTVYTAILTVVTTDVVLAIAMSLGALSALSKLMSIFNG